MTINRRMRLFIETDQAEDALHRITRDMTQVGIAAEDSARQGIAQLQQGFERFLRTTATGRNLKTSAPFGLDETIRLGSGKFGGGEVAFDKITAAQERMLTQAERAKLEILRFNQRLQQMARSGDISTTSLRQLRNSMGELGLATKGMGSNTARVQQRLAMMQAGLEEIESDFLASTMAAKSFGAELQGFDARSVEANRRLNQLSSAAQGAMLGMSLFTRNLVGAAFSLIFLRFAVIKTVAVVGALTVALLGAIGLIRAFQRLISVGSEAARTMEEFGQQMVNFFRDLGEGRRLTALSRDIAQTFGTEIDVAQTLVFELGKIGEANRMVATTILDTAAATGKGADEIVRRYTEIRRASADTRRELVEKFARDFNITNRAYASNIELLTALNERFGGSAAQAADTANGAIRRLNNIWTVFKESVGEVVNRFFRPMIDVALAFVKGLRDGFIAARNAAMATGDLQKEVSDFRAVMTRLIPVATSFGRWLGAVLVPILRLVMRMVKGLGELFLWWWRVTKPVRDALRALGQILKEHVIDRVIEAWKQFQDFAQFLDDKFGVPKEITISIGLALFGVTLASLAAFGAKVAAMAGAVAITKFIKIPIALAWLGRALVFSPASLSRFAISFIGRAIAALAAGGGLAAAGGALGAIPVAGWIALGVALVLGGLAILWQQGLLDEVGRWIAGKVKGFLKLNIKFFFGEVGWEKAEEIMGWVTNFFGNELLPFMKVKWRWLVDNVPLDTAAQVSGFIVGKIAQFLPILKVGVQFLEKVAGAIPFDRLQDFINWASATFKKYGIVGMLVLFQWRMLSMTFNSIKDLGRFIENWVRNNIRLSVIMDIVPRLARGALDAIVDAVKDALGGIPGVGGLSDIVDFGAGLVGQELQHGGVVRGPRGHPRLVMAHGGERFLGAPAFARQSSGGGGNVINITVNVSDSVVTNRQAMNELSEAIASQLITRLGVSRRMTLHRVSG